MAFDVVESLDATGDTMVARVPKEGSGEFTTGSQLVVQDNQVAVFYRDGRMADQFTPGRYTLSTQNLPVLKSLLSVPFKGKAPFRASVYFVNLKTFTDMGWGTPQPILFRDSELKMVNLRAHGTFALRIEDHVRFLNTLVGTEGLKTSGEIHEYLRKIVVSRFASTLPESLDTVIDLAGQYREIEASVKQDTRDDMGQYGLRLVDLVIESITVPPEVQQTIDRAAGTRSMDGDETDRYQQIAAADALRDASRTGGDGLTGGLGIGAGLAMGQKFASQMGQSQQGDGPPPPPQSGVKWYIVSNGQRVGPMSGQQLQAQIEAGQVTPQTLVWRKGFDNWRTAGDVTELKSVFEDEEPPPIPDCSDQQ